MKPLPEKKNCGDCAATPGSYHTLGCDTERCMDCGGQLISCDCNGTSLANEARELWTGVRPGVEQCHNLGWFAKRIPGLTGWQSCPEDDPDGRADLNRLAECEWDPETRLFVPPASQIVQAVKYALSERQVRHQKEREADRLAYAALPADQKYQQRRCPRCGQTNSLMPDQVCLDCMIKESTENRPEFESKPYYQVDGDILFWIFEPVATVSQWHPHGGFHTLHAHDDNRVVGFEIWWVSEFCAQLFALITEGADDALDKYRRAWRDKMDMENNWGADAVICMDTGERPVHGSCPTHGGDNCLRHPHAATHAKENERLREEIEQLRTQLKGAQERATDAAIDLDGP